MPRIYLDMKKFEEVAGFLPTTNRVDWEGLHVNQSNQGPYLYTEGTVHCLRIPAQVKDMVVEISDQVVTKSPQAPRELGRYIIDGNNWLEIQSYGKDSQTILISCTVDKFDDIKRLYDQVQAGTVRPSISYEKEQIAKPLGRMRMFWWRFTSAIRKANSNIGTDYGCT